MTSDNSGRPLTFVDILGLMGRAVFSSLPDVPASKEGLLFEEDDLEKERLIQRSNNAKNLSYSDNDGGSQDDHRNHRGIAIERDGGMNVTNSFQDSLPHNSRPHIIDGRPSDSPAHADTLDDKSPLSDGHLIKHCDGDLLDKDHQTRGALRGNLSEIQKCHPESAKRGTQIENPSQEHSGVSMDGFRSSRTIPACFTGHVETYHEKGGLYEDSLYSTEDVISDDEMFETKTKNISDDELNINDFEDFENDSIEDVSDINYNTYHVDCFTENTHNSGVSEAKLRASLAWLLSKVYGNQVPRELQDPFYQTADGQLVLRPLMINVLSSSELYCQACSNIFPETHTQWKGHWSIIQVLSRKGIYVADVKDTSVTETVLVQTAPFKLKAHIALIDALMRAYVAEVASVEKVVKAVRRLTNFNASSELPSNPEEALLFWINKVCHVLSSAGSDGEQLLEGQTSQKVRIVSKSSSPREPFYIPVMEDLMRDIGDGCNLAAVIAFYRPQQLSIKDVCLKDQIGIADSLYNLRRIGDFCKNYLPWKMFHLAYEDLLYTHEHLQVNIFAFVTDFFYCFEGPGVVSSEAMAKALVEKMEAIPAAGKKVPQPIPSVPISNATKKSFQRLPTEDTYNNLGMNRSITSPGSNQPLLSRRAAAAGKRTGLNDSQVTSPPYACDYQQQPTPSRRGRRVQSLSSPQERDTIHQSVLAWQDDQRLSVRSNQESSNLLANVSIDSDLDQSMNVDASLSVDLSALDTPRVPSRSALDPTHPDYMEVESLSSAHPSRYATPQQPVSDRPGQFSASPPQSDCREPLMPALLRATKERVAVMTKAQERGDRIPRKKRVSSPTDHSHGPLHQTLSAPADELSTNSSWSDETNVSSLPTGESQSPRYLPGESQDGGHHPPKQGPPNQKPYESFLAGGTDSSHLNPPESARSDTRSVAESYTVCDRPQTAQEAHAAGIPVVLENNDHGQGRGSREGSVASSGDYSDHESQKIHQDHKVGTSKRESGPPSSVRPPSVDQSEKPLKPLVIMERLSEGDDSGLGGKSSSTTANTTSFAELKRNKDKLGYKVDNSGLVYMQSGSQWDGDSNKSNIKVKERGQGDRGGKASVSFQPPPTMSWQQQQQQYQQQQQQLNNATDNNTQDCPPSDLQQLRLKLDQKRKEIERKKHRMEAQQNKMRQRLGKAAFMRVVSKHMDQVDSTPDAASNASPNPNSTQAQLQARLGHPGPRLPLAGSHGPGMQPQQPQKQSVYLGHPMASKPDTTLPPQVSAQRFTDWRSHSNQSKNASSLHDLQAQGIPDHPIEEASRNGQRPWDAASNSSSSGSSSQTAASKAFSREGIQQTIDNVKNRWFNSDSDLISGAGSEDEMDGDVTSYRLHQPLPQSLANSQTPLKTIQPQSSSSPVTIPARPSSTSSLHHSSEEETLQEYDSSLDKLNNSLSELQGEIMRLSLQHEQLKATELPGERVEGIGLSDALSAIGSSTVVKSRPIHGIPVQAPYVHGGASQPSPQQQTQQQQQQQPNQQLELLRSTPTLATNVPSQSPLTVSGSEEAAFSGSDTSGKDGFFISFANDSTPKRPKPKLSDRLSDHRGDADPASSLSRQITSEPQRNMTPQITQSTLSPNNGDVVRAESPAHVGFVIKDASETPEKVNENDMEKKKIKLLEMQKKRKEEQERKRIEKETASARKLEAKQQKEEEHERKKADDKARRDAIFQQYLCKKQSEDDPPPPPIKKRSERRPNSRPRPKSMYVKAMTPEPGARGGGFDSNSSSQEDVRLDNRRESPNIMSVSCNTLPQNGAPSPTTYRRPPSPDSYRPRQHRQRGNSQDSGSETGSGSNPGSDYAGPKLYVKPSAKSNRHIIVNAISHCCLAGSVNTEIKNKVLEEMSKCDANHFLILFRDAGCQYRGLFIFYPDTEEAFKVFGVGPKHITNKICEKFYKYNSGAKSFTEIVSTKHLSVSVDAVVLLSSVWKTGKAVIRR